MTIQYKNSSIVQTGTQLKGPGTPTDAYLSSVGEWKRNRAIIQGQSYAKDYDQYPDADSNLLLPFSSSMTQEQYDFYKAEAELPGITSQYAKMLIGGLLRKLPLFELPERVSEEIKEEAKDWIINRFGSNNESLISFLDTALWEEMQSSRAWLQVDYPVVDMDSLSPEQRSQVSPYPTLWAAESIINWSQGGDPVTGETKLDMLITRYYSSRVNANSPFHPSYVDTVDVHMLRDGLYVIDTYVSGSSNQPILIDGAIDQNYGNTNNGDWELVSTNENLFINGERMDFIPFYPLNGSIEIQDPSFTPLVHREIALYNKISRRNHLSYLSATYTPVVKSDGLTEEEKDRLVKQGLGTWLFVGSQDSIETLSTPTDALKDMEASIKAGYEELTRIGVKMLSLEPNNSDQSGVALEIRNAAQAAQISTLNAKVSESLRKVLTVMLNWKYDLDLAEDEIRFGLSSDFNALPVGADWMRLITEWYQSGIIPRSTFIEIAKNNDVVPIDYNDDLGQDEIEADPIVATPREVAIDNAPDTSV